MDISRAIPIIVTPDPAGSRRFYEALLGMQVRMEHDGFLLLVSPSAPAIQVIVAWESPTAWDPQVTGMDLSIDLADRAAVDAAHEAAAAAGLEITYPPMVESFGRYRFVVREPGGARV